MGADRAERLEWRVMTAFEPAPIENCDECGFRWDRYTDEQAVGVYLVTGGLFRGVLDGVDLELANTAGRGIVVDPRVRRSRAHCDVDLAVRGRRGGW